MALPTQLNATEQDTLVKQIGLSLLRAAPRDWRRVTAEYRAVGRFHELTGEVVAADGATQEWMATHDIATLFGRLRAGMYREGRGTWFNARYQLDHPSSYNLEYDREEPDWDLAPPPQAYADELRMFPRSEENVPDWLMRRMAGLGPERPGPRFRLARIFDGAGPNGPVINRPELDAEEQSRLLDYLDGAPVVVPGRGYDIDRLANTPESTVPIAFHSDGSWIWPAAVNYYLREYGIAPEPDLTQHIRANGFSIPDVPDAVRQAAATHITRGQQAQQRSTPPPPAPPAPAPEAAPEPAPPMAVDEPPFDEYFSDHGAERTQLAEPARLDEPPLAEPHELADDDTAEYTTDEYAEQEQAAQAEPATTFTAVPDLPELAELNGGPPTTLTPPALEPDSGEEGQVTPPSRQVTEAQPRPGRAELDDDGGPPTQFALAPAPPRYDEPALNDLEEKLEELGIPEEAYRIGAPAARGWSIEQVGDGWRVGWYDGELTSPAVFGDVGDAAAFMLGKVLLAPGGVGEVPPPAPVQEERPAPPPPAVAPPPPRPVTATLSPEQATGMRPPATREAGPADGAPPRHVPPAPPREHAPVGRRGLGDAVPTGAAIPTGAAPQRRAEGGRPAEKPEPRQSGGQQQWPIQPMPGEPPLTLFRGKEMRTLPIGSELDRFGGANGNLTYAAGTPFEERSLVPEWVSRPYHLYRVQRPLEALAGVAIPWFNQPGGGAAYLLPASIEELLAEGDLIELEPGEPPID
ncbi:TNT domain-containing protein [Saccharomonospora sp. NPDC046836]|uniref:TNT domain-containing protein n=1 Tax=Saccharomonospora sp. NPDC046836 TaxID=3156921 RepID=UPI003402BC64